MRSLRARATMVVLRIRPPRRRTRSWNHRLSAEVGWFCSPLWAQALGAVLIALCMITVWQTFRFNTFAAPQVRIQKDREQRVITDGPYRIVRHPRYAGALLMFVGTPLL